jgi:nicotinamidase-related amidase
MLTNPERSALLVIDVQTGLFSIPDFDLHEPDALLARISDLLAEARHRRIPVVYVQHLGEPGSAIEAGTEGCEIHSAIAPQAGELVVNKSECDSFLRTTLQAELEALGVKTLIVCGLQSEYCVDTACRRAHGLGYEVLLVRDGHSTGGGGSLTGQQIVDHQNETLGGSFVTLCAAEEVFA